MDVPKAILSKYLPASVFIGKTRKSCHLAKLSFDGGFITWNMNSQIYIAIPDNDEKTLLYFSSFFGFTDYVESINTICQFWLHYQFKLTRINLLADLFKEYFPWSTFVLGCQVPKAAEAQTLTYGEFGPESFVRYLRQALPVQHLTPIVQAAEKSMMYFLRELLVKTGFNMDPTINISIGHVMEDQELPLEKLDLAVKAFYREYVNTWLPKLKLCCQKSDQHDIPTAMAIADRCGLSVLAVHRYLAHRKLSLEAAIKPE